MLGTVGVLVLVLVASCATATRSRSTDHLLIDSDPTGAAIWVNGLAAGMTPKLVLMPSDRVIQVRCTLRGYRDATATVFREVAPAAAFDGPLFAAIDQLTGAAYPLQRRSLLLELTPAPVTPL